MVSRLSYHHVGPGPITAGDIPREDRPLGEFDNANWCDAGFSAAIHRAVELGVGLKQISQAAAQTAIQIACESENGNLQRAARRLRVTDRALQMRRAAHRQEIKLEHLDRTG